MSGNSSSPYAVLMNNIDIAKMHEKNIIVFKLFLWYRLFLIQYIYKLHFDDILRSKLV